MIRPAIESDFANRDELVAELGNIDEFRRWLRLSRRYRPLPRRTPAPSPFGARRVGRP
jgi:hypothetical protein